MRPFISMCIYPSVKCPQPSLCVWGRRSAPLTDRYHFIFIKVKVNSSSFFQHLCGECRGGEGGSPQWRSQMIQYCLCDEQRKLLQSDLWVLDKPHAPQQTDWQLVGMKTKNFDTKTTTMWRTDFFSFSDVLCVLSTEDTELLDAADWKITISNMLNNMVWKQDLKMLPWTTFQPPWNLFCTGQKKKQRTITTDVLEMV